MQGSVFITHTDGWACSNEVLLDVETDIENGLSKKTTHLKIKGLFEGAGSLKKDSFVDCVFKKEDDGLLQGFTGSVTGILPTLASIKITAKTNRLQEILSKIKEEN